MQRGQVVKLERGYPLVRTDEGSFVRCEHATALVKGEEVRAVIGDFVEVTVPEGHDKGIIESILPRTRAFVRKDPTERALPQVLAANFDRVFVAQPLSDVNVRRLERELVLAYETGAAVTVVLTKADLAESDADIICLQEAWLSSNKSKYMSERRLQRILKAYPYYSSAYAVKDHGSRLIVLSKYPILSTRPIDLHSDFNGGAVFTILVGEKKLVLYNLHLESFGFTKEEQAHYFQLAQEVNPKGFTQALGVRFSPAFKRRAKQVEQIYQDVNYQESPYVLICGDFNDTPISYTHHRLSTGLHDAIATTGRGTNYSYYFKSLIGVRIDHMLYSDQIEARAAYVDRTAEISDHKPIICYFKLK